ncbi:heterokaryon incompatibility protein-domain-containing protein [Halenospora varia]|nr:heterokaryon incompatibility protein-domain-containing protein [Halenospora varia]
MASMKALFSSRRHRLSKHESNERQEDRNRSPQSEIEGENDPMLVPESFGINSFGFDPHSNRVMCRMDWQLDGRLQNQASGQSKSDVALTRRMRFYSEEGFLSDAYAVVLPRQSEEPETSSPSFLGRAITSREIDIARTRRWISLCQENHESSCQSLYQSTVKKQGYTPMRIIDVEKMYVVQTTTEVTYATLSYMWGNSPIFKLICENFAMLSSEGGLEAVFDNLARTIQDAIRLVRDMGMRYIWVDSLCIIQDDKMDWEKSAPTMDKIYGNSLFTLCGATGRDAAAGLPRAVPHSRNLVQLRENCAGLDLLVVRPVESHIRSTSWNSGAWTFQERVMSTRCLIFVDDRAFFQCRQATWSEELDCEGSTPAWNLDMIGSPLTLFNANPLRRYSTCVQLYSSRKLTFMGDKLIAFEGIGNVLSVPLDCKLYHGLPDSHFDWALLWELSEPAKEIPEEHLQRRHVGPKFPSWSWCGWDGGVEWRLSTISGALVNMHEWLTEHTWIVWYKAVLPERGSGPGAPEWTHELVWRPVENPLKTSRWSGYVASDNKIGPYGRSANSETAIETSKREHVPRADPIENCLHFWTYSAFFSLSRTSMSDAKFKSNLHPGLRRFGIHDSKGDWCETIILEESQINPERVDPANGIDHTYEFIAISEAKDFDLEEYDSWTYYVPQEREQAEWYLYYSLLIQWNEDKTVARRLGLAKIYKAAFKSASFAPGMSWKEITLG